MYSTTSVALMESCSSSASMGDAGAAWSLQAKLLVTRWGDLPLSTQGVQASVSATMSTKHLAIHFLNCANCCDESEKM